MNPQQPMQDSGVAPSPEQPIVGGEPVAVVPQISQPEVVPQAQLPQVDSFSPSPITTPTQPSTVQADAQGSSAPIAVQPVAASVVQPAGQPVITPSAGLVPSTPGIPTMQPPVPPITGQGTVGSSGPAMSPYPMPTEGTKKQKFIKLGVIGGAVVVLLMAGVFGFMMWKNGQIALETYEGDGFSVLVPSEYKESGEDGAIVFEENTDDETSQSGLFIAAEKIEATSQEEFNEVKTTFKDQYKVEDLLSQTDEDSDNTMTNVTYDTTDTDKELTYEGTADIEKDGEKVGTAYFMITLDKENGLGVVMIGAHESDSALAKNSQKIIDSFAFE